MTKRFRMPAPKPNQLKIGWARDEFDEGDVIVTPEMLNACSCLDSDGPLWIADLFPTPEGKKYIAEQVPNLIFFTEYS